jgi:hypothetical protein
VGEDAIIYKERIYTNLPCRASTRNFCYKVEKDARPDLNASLLVIADDVHGRLAKLDNTFLLEFLYGLD